MLYWVGIKKNQTLNDQPVDVWWQSPSRSYKTYLGQNTRREGKWIKVFTLRATEISEEWTIINGKCKAEGMLISRIAMIPTDLYFVFKQLQFPVGFTFAMTINEVQGQSMWVEGLYL